MATNLVVVAMDGVSQTLFWQYREAVPFLWRVSERSAMFRRFYTASTSTLQSFCDFAYGDAGELDHNLTYPEQGSCLAGRSANLFSLLSKRGFKTLGIQHGSGSPDYCKNNFFGAWPMECGEFHRHGEYSSFNAAVDAFLDGVKRAGAPFALYFSERTAMLADDSPEKRGLVFHERTEKGFRLLDQSVSALFDKLTEREMVNDTIFIFYGPFGTDPWKHGVYSGHTHAVDPYADMCWTPLFILSAEGNVCITDQLVSIVDLKPTILQMLFPEGSDTVDNSPLTGKSILSFQRQIALSQNLFALEQENTGAARGLCKSYAITDGNHRLIVSADGGIAGEGGMELYFDLRDPGNTRNFLDFFELDSNGNMTVFGRPDIIHVHFTQSFKQHLVMSIVHSYNAMRGQLYELVRLKEKQAITLTGGKGGANVLPDASFKVKRRRK